jgi:hypothetical protein
MLLTPSRHTSGIRATNDNLPAHDSVDFVLSIDYL